MNIYNIDNFIFRGLTAMVLLAWFLVPATAEAYFSSSATAEGNNFSVGTLILDVSAADTNAEITATSSDAVSFTVDNTGSVTERYLLNAAVGSCSTKFWDGLEIEVEDGGVLYSGPIEQLSATSAVSGTWTATFSAGSNLQAQDGDECDVTLQIESWQTLFSSSTQGGFSDDDSFTVTVKAGEDMGQQSTANVVLNEIYPNPISTTTPLLDEEWIELYNGTSNSVDVSGWVVSEFTSGMVEKKREIVNVCPSTDKSKYMTPYGTSGTDIAPGGLMVLEFCAGANYLNNGGDTVSLYTSTTSVTAIDSYAYPNTPAGKSHARIPDGSSWVDPVPTPGTANTATKEELVTAGWSESEIESVLGEEEILVDDKKDMFKFNSEIKENIIQNATTTSSTSPEIDIASSTNHTEMLATTTASGTPDISIGNDDGSSTTTDKEVKNLDESPIVKEEEIITEETTKKGDSSKEGDDTSEKEAVKNPDTEEKDDAEEKEVTEQDDTDSAEEKDDAEEKNTKNEDQEKPEPVSKEIPPEEEINETKEVKEEAVAEDTVEDTSESADEAISNEEKS